MIQDLWHRHPNLISWLLLAIGMVAVVIVSARHVGFTVGQWSAIIGATVLLAGLSVWIISWEDEEDEIQ